MASQLVVVPKKNGKWHVYVDYSNLNDACSKDTFPLHRVDQIVDAIAGHDQLSFLDAYSGYNQIPMFSLNLSSTTFIMPTGMYFYNLMSFGIKNVRATNQCMMSHMLEIMLGKTMEVYIDDMLVKLKSRDNHLAHMQETFQLMRQHHLRLNLNKCTFGVESKKFLSFLVSVKSKWNRRTILRM